MSIKIEGLSEIQAFLEKEVPRQANNILRTTVHAIASDIAKDAKANARAVGAVRSKELIKGFKAKRRKTRKGMPISVVIGAPHWHLVEYGTKQRVTKKGKNTGAMPETPIVRPAIDKIRANMPLYLENNLKKKLAAAANRAKKRAKK